jgi:replicative DNA helicase
MKNEIPFDPYASKGMPNAVEIEKAVLGVVLLDNLLVAELIDSARVDDFYLNSHRLIFRAMVRLGKANRPIDALTLTEELRSKDEFEQAGGFTGIGALVDGAPRTSSLKYYLEILRDKATRRDLVRYGARIEAQGLEDEETTAEIMANANRELIRIEQQSPEPGLVHVGVIAQKVFDQMEALYAQHQGSTAMTTGVASGFSDIDTLTAGWQKPNLILLAARPSQGKTALALNFAENAASRDLVVGFFSLEMSAEELISRSMAGQAGVDSHRVRAGYLNRDEWDRLSQGWKLINEMKLWVNDSSGLKPTQLRAKAQRLKLEQGRLDLVIVDYLQLISNRMDGRNRQEEVAGISRELKAMAKDLNCPVIALSQLSRGLEKENRYPNLSDLRESGALEQDADLVCLLHRDKKTPVVKFILAKQRNGPTGNCYLRFDKSLLRFQPCAANEAETENPTQGDFDY